MTNDKPFRYLTSAEFLQLAPNERIDYLKRVTDDLLQRAKQIGRATDGDSTSNEPQSRNQLRVLSERQP
jgi:hypothetical protein